MGSLYLFFSLLIIIKFDVQVSSADVEIYGLLDCEGGVLYCCHYEVSNSSGDTTAEGWCYEYQGGQKVVV